MRGELRACTILHSGRILALPRRMQQIIVWDTRPENITWGG
jgi:hypothetical protein